MKFQVIEIHGKRYVEAPAGQRVMRNVNDATRLIEACWNEETDCLLAYPENLTERFFDLSSTEAGEILQKLRNYRIRMAVVGSPEAMNLSSRFADLMIEENRNRYFRLFHNRADAETWLLEG